MNNRLLILSLCLISSSVFAFRDFDEDEFFRSTHQFFDNMFSFFKPEDNLHKPRETSFHLQPIKTEKQDGFVHIEVPLPDDVNAKNIKAGFKGKGLILKNDAQEEPTFVVTIEKKQLKVLTTQQKQTVEENEKGDIVYKSDSSSQQSQIVLLPANVSLQEDDVKITHENQYLKLQIAIEKPQPPRTIPINWDPTTDKEETIEVKKK